jgi:hypothetical protein
MSWELTRLVLNLRNLTPTEKAVAHSLAYHAPKDGSAYPSMGTIALEAGLRNRTAAQKVVRRLETRGIVSPTTSKKGGRKNPTHYRFNFGNSIPTDALSDTENSIPKDSVSAETASLETRNSIPGDARDKGDKEKRDREPESVSLDFPSEMADEIWDYYVEQIGKNPAICTFTPSRKKIGAARFAEALEMAGGDPRKAIILMKCAVDALHDSEWHNGKNDAKAAYNEWETLFCSAEKFQNWLARAERA